VLAARGWVGAVSCVVAGGVCGGLGGHSPRPPDQRPSSAAMAGVMKDRTTRVSKSSPSHDGGADLPAMRRSLTSMEPMVKANTRPAVVTTAGAPPMERMMPVFSPAWISFLEPGDQQQVVVRSHGQHDHDGHREHQPVQRHVQQVLPNQYEMPKEEPATGHGATMTTAAIRLR